MRLPPEFENITIGNILAEHPQIGEILSKHHIDCVSCGSGSCLFKNVVATHTYDRKKVGMIEAEINEYLAGSANRAKSLVDPL
jgi:hypothetical protein